MARGINKVILIGNLGIDPEVRYTPNGSAVANITLATSSSWRDKQTGELQERTEWHRIAFFNRLAEIVGEYLHKGSKIYIEGSLRTRKWQDKNTGADRYTTEIIANEMQILDNRSGSGNYQNTAQSSSRSTNTPSNNTTATPGTGATATTSTTSSASDEFNDDIPF